MPGTGGTYLCTRSPPSSQGSRWGPPYDPLRRRRQAPGPGGGHLPAAHRLRPAGIRPPAPARVPGHRPAGDLGGDPLPRRRGQRGGDAYHPPRRGSGGGGGGDREYRIPERGRPLQYHHPLRRRPGHRRRRQRRPRPGGAGQRRPAGRGRAAGDPEGGRQRGCHPLVQSGQRPADYPGIERFRPPLPGGPLLGHRRRGPGAGRRPPDLRPAHLARPPGPGGAGPDGGGRGGGPARREPGIAGWGRGIPPAPVQRAHRARL